VGWFQNTLFNVPRHGYRQGLSIKYKFSDPFWSERAGSPFLCRPKTVLTPHCNLPGPESFVDGDKEFSSLRLQREKYQKSLTVMTESLFGERKVLPCSLTTLATDFMQLLDLQHIPKVS
jgi:hypothetical protein